MTAEPAAPGPRRAPSRGPWALVLVGLGVALLLGMGLANFADANPDGLERAVIATQCPPDADAVACLDELAGDPVFPRAPLPDYEVTWLSGLVGVAACFAVGAGVVLLVRGGKRGPRQRDRERVPPQPVR
jgi:hypothetical protein